MKKLPSIKATELLKILKRNGFDKKRQHGSHVFVKHEDGRTSIIPNHPTETIDRSLLNKIIKHDLKISRKEFFKWLEK